MGVIPYQTIAAFAVPALLAGSIVGLVAVWAALGRTHWFWRAAAVEVAAIIWLLIPAYELVLMFFVQSLVVTGALTVAAWWRGQTSGDAIGSPHHPPARLQFGIRDLLLLTLLVAVAVSTLAAIPIGILTQGDGSTVANYISQRTTTPWIEYTLYGVFLGLVTLLAAWVALGRVHWPWRMAVGVAVLPVAPMALWLTLARTFRADQRRRRWPAAIGLVCISLFLAVPVAAIFWKLAVRSPIPPNTATEANVYPELIAVARRANSSFPAYDSTQPLPAGAAALLADLRPLLGRECQATPTYTWADLDTEAALGMLTLGRFLHASARSAEKNKNSAEAVEACVDCIRLGRMMQRGGFLVELLTGTGIEGMGHGELKLVITAVDEPQCLRLGEELTRFRDRPEPLEDVWERERIWYQHALTWSHRLEPIVSEELLGFKCPHVDAIRGMCDRRSAMIEILFCALALRRYELRHGNLPERLEELSPEFLPSVPIDPLNGGPLFYQRDGKGYLLYSTAMPSASEFGPPEKPAAVAVGDEDALPENDEDADSF
jgi:hypothetical protein